MADAGENDFKKRSFEPISMICFVVLVIACVVVLCTYASDHYFSDDDEPVEYGDTIEYEYVGSLYGYYNDNSSVVPVIFDTNISKVGKNSDYTFLSSFKKTEYKATSLKIGSGTTVGDFESQMIGHKEGETFKIFISGAQGYPGADENAPIDVSKFLPPGPISQATYNTMFGTTGTLTAGSHVEYVKVDVADENNKLVVRAVVGSNGMITLTYDTGSFVIADSKVGKVTATFDGTVWSFTVENTINTDVPATMYTDIEMVTFNFLGQQVNVVGMDGATPWVNYKADTGTNIIQGMDLYFVVKIVSIN